MVTPRSLQLTTAAPRRTRDDVCADELSSKQEQQRRHVQTMCRTKGRRRRRRRTSTPSFASSARSALLLLAFSFVLATTFTTTLPGADATDASDGLFHILDLNNNGFLERKEFDLGISKFQSFLTGSGGDSGGQKTGGDARDKEGAGDNEDGDGAYSTLHSFWKGFTSSLAMIIATEIGDKTFFIAAVLSMKHSRSAVFIGAITALVVMTIMSTAMGLILPQLLPRSYTHIIGGILFLYFGFRLLYDGKQMEAGKASDELEEVETELLQQSNKKDDIEEGTAQPPAAPSSGLGSAPSGLGSAPSTGNGIVSEASATIKKSKSSVVAAYTQKPWYSIIIQSFTLTFVAEWGDRSQIATIALGASRNPFGVTVGGCLGHSLCTGLAVVGGRILAARISEKTVSLGGGAIFCFFGVFSLFFEK